MLLLDAMGPLLPISTHQLLLFSLKRLQLQKIEVGEQWQLGHHHKSESSILEDEEVVEVEAEVAEAVVEEEAAEGAEVQESPQQTSL